MPEIIHNVLFKNTARSDFIDSVLLFLSKDRKSRLVAARIAVNKCEYD